MMTYPSVVKWLCVLFLAVCFLCASNAQAAAAKVTPGKAKWSVFLDAITNTPAIGADGTLYVSTQDVLYALHPGCGSILWMRRIGTDERPIQSAPVIGADGTIFAAVADGCVHALAPADGSELWTYDTGVYIYATPAVGADGTLYVGVYPDDIAAGISVYALNPADGSVKWDCSGLGRIKASPVIGADGSIYIASWEQNLYALDPADGSIKWTYETDLGVFSAPAVGADGTVYIGCDEGMSALHPADGSEKWCVSLSVAGWWLSPAIAVGGAIYLPRFDGPLFALDPADGSVLWSTEASNDKMLKPVAVGDDGVIYALFLVWEFGSLQALDPMGNTLWSIGLGMVGPHRCPPVIGQDGTLFIASKDTLYAISTTSGGLADSAWPMFQHDIRHSGSAEIVVLNPMDPVTPVNGAVDQPARVLLQWRDTNYAPQEEACRLRLKPAGGAYTYVTCSQNSSHTFMDLAGATTYYWNLQALGDGQRTIDSPWANGGTDWVFTTSDGGCSRLNPPILQSPVDLAHKQPLSPTLAWLDGNDTPQEDGYQVRIKPEAGDYTFYVTGQDVCQATIPRLAGDACYYWNVRAVGDNTSTLDSDWANGGEDWRFITARAFAGTGFVKWSIKLDGCIYSSPALGVDGTTLFIGANDGKLYAVDIVDQSIKWTFVTGDFVYSSPAIAANGTVYIGSRDGYLYALDPDKGKVIWKHDTGGEIRDSAAIGGDGTVYIGSWAGTLYALSHVDGSILWAAQLGGRGITSSPVIGLNNRIYVSVYDYSYQNKLFALNMQDGAILWELQLEDAPTSPAIGADGTVYACADNTLYALEPDTGNTKWQTYLSYYADNPPVIGADGTIYVHCDKLYAIDPLDGSVKWFSLTYKDLHQTPAVGADDCIYVPGGSTLYAVEPTAGRLVWTCPLDSSVYTSPVISPDGTIYLGTHNGYLLAISSDSGGLADSPWPMLQHDARHTGRAGAAPAKP